MLRVLDLKLYQVYFILKNKNNNLYQKQIITQITVFELYQRIILPNFACD